MRFSVAESFFGFFRRRFVWRGSEAFTLAARGPAFVSTGQEQYLWTDRVI